MIIKSLKTSLEALGTNDTCFLYHLLYKETPAKKGRVFVLTCFLCTSMKSTLEVYHTIHLSQPHNKPYGKTFLLYSLTDRLLYCNNQFSKLGLGIF